LLFFVGGFANGEKKKNPVFFFMGKFFLNGEKKKSRCGKWRKLNTAHPALKRAEQFSGFGLTDCTGCTWLARWWC